MQLSSPSPKSSSERSLQWHPLIGMIDIEVVPSTPQMLMLGVPSKVPLAVVMIHDGLQEGTCTTTMVDVCKTPTPQRTTSWFVS